MRRKVRVRHTTSCSDELALLMTYREAVMKLCYRETRERRQKRILALARQKMVREESLDVARVLFWINGGNGEPTGHDLLEIAAESRKHTPVASSAQRRQQGGKI